MAIVILVYHHPVDSHPVAFVKETAFRAGVVITFRRQMTELVNHAVKALRDLGLALTENERGQGGGAGMNDAIQDDQPRGIERRKR